MKFSEEFNKIVEYAQNEAARTGCRSIETKHLLLGIIRHKNNSACLAIEASGADSDELKKTLDDSLGNNPAVPFPEIGSIELSLQARGVIGLAMFEARTAHATQVMAIHLLLGISNSEERSFLERLGISHSSLMEQISKASERRKKKEITFVIPIDPDKPLS